MEKSYTVTFSYTINVNAENENNAVQKANKRWDEDAPRTDEMNVDVEEYNDNKTINILFHTISYWYDNGQDISESEQEHIEYMICQGYREGELNDSNDEEDIRGYWKIVTK